MYWKDWLSFKNENYVFYFDLNYLKLTFTIKIKKTNQNEIWVKNDNYKLKKYWNELFIEINSKKRNGMEWLKLIRNMKEINWICFYELFYIFQ